MGEERDQEEHQENNKQQLCDARGRNCYSRKAEDRRDQCHHKKCYDPVKHDVTSVNFAIINSS
jgi:hypothetical protein